MIPLLYCRNMEEAIRFYTGTLGFSLKYPDASADDLVVDLTNEHAELQLTSLPGDQRPGIAVNVRIDDVDALFAGYLSRGLDTSAKKESPVHQGPIDQTWGRREFYVTDPSGNTLRFGASLE